MTQKRDARRRPRAAWMRAAALGAACLLVAAAWAANKSSRRAADRTPASRAHAASAAPEARQKAGGPESSGAEWPYEVVLARNLFKPPGASEPAQEEEPVPPMPVDPFELSDVSLPPSDETETQLPWVYAGYATADGAPVAIVQNTETKTANFLSAGDALQGYVVREITSTRLELDREGEPMSLTISDAFTATPLDEPAASSSDERSGTQGAQGEGPGMGPGGAEGPRGAFSRQGDGNTDSAERDRRTRDWRPPWFRREPEGAAR